ncbi:hypothetical protein K440DRAFT_660727 [Wilcoxina mikolae CBS 423.85]|nr:hypothetical protein K440DRAFT_660727 [Wilcoxina mikolae CBS 423.85]
MHHLRLLVTSFLFILTACAVATPHQKPEYPPEHIQPEHNPELLTCCPDDILAPACEVLGLGPCPGPASQPAPALVNVCTPDGGPCDLSRPDLCCNQICFNGQPTPVCGGGG